MKRLILSWVALSCAMLGAMAQRSYTFNAVALNVDGLPKEIAGKTINEDGREAEGATELCGKLANSGWDIVGFSEDFNFHDYLEAKPATNYYNFGEHSGEVSVMSILRSSCDGLGFACAKYLTMSGGTRVAWEDYNGYTDQGADGLVTKGFRVYTVTFATGVAVDVYVLHMDAEDGEGDIAVRNDQLGELVTYIKGHKNGRPIIILGDFNCRYFRDKVKTDFIDVINADSRLTVKDAWVELMWGGAYPEYGGDAMMTHTYGDQKGEVVDKIFYINDSQSSLTIKANSYLHDTSVKISDHYPVVVNFTITDTNGTPLTAAEKEDNWTLDLSDGGEPAPVFMGVQPEDGKAYFLKNVDTGLYLKWGAEYGARGILGSAGVAFTFKKSGSNWVLKTSENSSLLGDPNTWLDNPNMNEWTLELVPGTEYQYYIRNSHGTLSPIDNDNLGRVNTVTHNANDDRQKWVLLTSEKVKTEMLQGNGTFPYDVTPLLRAADFDRFDDEYGIYSNWTGADENTIGGIWWEGGDNYNGCAAIVNVTKSTSLSQTISGMPAGTYKVSFEGFYRNIKNSNDQTMPATVTVGDETFNLEQNTTTGINTDRYVPGGVFRDNDTYAQTGTFTLSGSSNNITFKATNPSSTGNNWVCLDNIKLLYSATGFSDPNLEYKQTVMNKVNAVYEDVMKLNAGGQAAYDITVVMNRVRNNQVTSTADATAMCKIVDVAYANAYAVHLATIVAEAVGKMDANGGDVTGAIINPSFETGDLTGWSVGGGQDVGVYPNSNGTYTTNGCDGIYLFNSWDGDEGHGSHVKQTVKGIPNGLYELKASLASFSQTDGRTHNYHMFLFANGYNTSVEAKSNKQEFEEATLYFLVEDGTATIGAVGGNKGGGNKFIHYWPDEGCFLKADNFRLKRICDVPHGRLKLALDEAKTAKFDSYGQAALDLSDYENKYNNMSLNGDGTAEAEAVYDALKIAAKAQRTKDVDMTWAIENPSFETGDYRGWSTTEGWDTGAKLQEGITYDVKVAGTKGRYLFNTWNDQENTDKGTANVNIHIKQTVTDIPNGTYKVTAMLATDAGKELCLTANGITTTIAASGNGKTSGVFPEVTCEVTNGELTIEAGGVNNVWYKCDNFRLTYLGHAITLSEGGSYSGINDWYTDVTLNRSITAGRWNTFVVPFDMAIPDGWEVKELTDSKMDGDIISLTFNDAASIEAGVAYMVRKKDSNVTIITAENVQVNTALANPETSHVEFVGTYTKGNIPEGSFFISNNVFYQAADNSNTIKAFRAYFTSKIDARALNYRIDGEEDATGIDRETGDVTVVGIYTLGGVRIDDMQDGVNILQMSDGSVIKVVIK